TLGYDHTSICGSSSNRNFALGSTTLSGPMFSGVNDLDDAFFDDAPSFRGAFGSTDWSDGWSEWAPQGVNYCGEFRMQDGGDNSLQLKPNPGHNVTYAVFNTEEAEKVEVSVLDKIDGKPIVTPSHSTGKGVQRMSIAVTGLR